MLLGRRRMTVEMQGREGSPASRSRRRTRRSAANPHKFGAPADDDGIDNDQRQDGRLQSRQRPGPTLALGSARWRRAAAASMSCRRRIGGVGVVGTALAIGGWVASRSTGAMARRLDLDLSLGDVGSQSRRQRLRALGSRRSAATPRSSAAAQWRVQRHASSGIALQAGSWARLAPLASTARRTGASASAAAMSFSAWESSARQTRDSARSAPGGQLRPQACRIDIVRCSAVRADDQHRRIRRRGTFRQG